MKDREGNGSTGERIKAAARKGEREIIAGVKKTSREYTRLYERTGQEQATRGTANRVKST